MSLEPRPPIVAILGHVDHGKTTLLDYIRKTRVQLSEAGGMTQHIGAYQIAVPETSRSGSGQASAKKITFIDTPGHAAFNKMRQRGAKVTDLVLLVVAANDGVKPQTIESIRYIRESKVPFIVVINKIDLKDIKLDNVKAQLAEQNILVQGFGGDVEVVEISAKTGKNVDKLLETILVTAELLELKADPTAPLRAVVIESARDERKGPLARVIVKQGTLKVRQNLVCDQVSGRVRSLTDERGQQLPEVPPGSPCEIIGFDAAPEVGAIVLDADRLAETTVSPEASDKKAAESEQPASQPPAAPAEFADLDFEAAFGDKQKIKLIIRSDAKGTLEAVVQNIDPESVDLLFAGVGQVTEQDLELARASNALIVAFHLKLSRRILNLAKSLGVRLKQYDIIYHLIEDLQKQMLKILEPTIDEIETGTAEVLQIFEMKGERIAGVRVRTGQISRTDLLHLKRGDEIIANPVIKAMKHGKEDILVIKTKNEAGLTFKNRNLDFKPGDMIVAYKKEE